MYKQIHSVQKFRPVSQIWIKNFHISFGETENADPVDKPSNFKYGMYSAVGLLLTYGTYRLATSKFTFCLFYFEMLQWANEKNSISIVVQNLFSFKSS